MLLICLTEGAEVALRFAFGRSDTRKEPWRNCAEKYFDLKPGLTFAWLDRATYTHCAGKRILIVLQIAQISHRPCCRFRQRPLGHKPGETLRP
jgi:hypothetical protein